MTSSDKIRVYELSRDLKLENRDILDAAQKLSISVKSHSSSINLEDAKKITNLINNKNTSKTILSVSKSSSKAKTEKIKKNDTQIKDNKTVLNTLHKDNSSKEQLNKKPLLIKPVNKPKNSISSSSKKNLNKLLKNKNFHLNISKTISNLRLKKFKTLILLNYVPELNNFLYWCQQLLAESLGKNKKGFLPVVSNAPKDHHSLLQLYLDGPKDKVFYIFSSKKTKNILTSSNFFGEKMKYLNNKDYQDIKIVQKDALKEVLKKKKNPFREIIIKKFNEDTLGKLFLSFIVETIILGKYMKINPYDQPAVEEVKVLTRKFLI